MSYDISSFKIKKINNLSIPMKCISEAIPNRDKSWKLERTDFENHTEFYNGNFALMGAVDIENDRFHIANIVNSDDGSGIYYFDFLLPALKESQGELRALVVWEDDGMVMFLNVKDGEVEVEDIE